MEIILFIGKIMLYLSALSFGLFFMTAIFSFLDILKYKHQQMFEMISSIALIISITTFFIGISLVAFEGFFGKDDNKTLIKIESSTDYDLYYDRDTNIIYCIPSDSTTPLYNTDGSFKLYTED